MKRGLYDTIDLVLTGLFALVVMPLLGVMLLVSTPTWYVLRLMGRARKWLAIQSRRNRDAAK
jgi:uncharacterized membrane protein